MSFKSLIFVVSITFYGQTFVPASCCVNNNDFVVDNQFIKMGKYRGLMADGSEYKKSYYYPKTLKAGWIESINLCKKYNLELATMESEDEAIKFLSLAENFPIIANMKSSKYFFIDGMTFRGKSIDDWYWTKTWKKITFRIPWGFNEPSFYNEIEYCMSIGKDFSSARLGFNDIQCVKEIHPFICQKFDFYIDAKDLL